MRKFRKSDKNLHAISPTPIASPIILNPTASSTPAHPHALQSESLDFHAFPRAHRFIHSMIKLTRKTLPAFDQKEIMATSAIRLGYRSANANNKRMTMLIACECTILIASLNLDFAICEKSHFQMSAQKQMV